MNKPLGLAALAVGLLTPAWVAYGYLGSNTLALLMTLLIVAFYLMGALELHRFRQATASLQAALAALPERLDTLAVWITTLPPALQQAVRQRIEGERVGLPGPSMTPYLVGLLVLLGMLGTFVGMVVTLQGTVMAMESTTDLPTLRAALSAPIKGLGLAFGTSVAGVAASAMLGLLSALCRRERLAATGRLDAHIATGLRVFSPAHQREQTLLALQTQARVMPEVADRLLAMMAAMERHSDSLNQRLLDGQQRFHDHAQASYATLASSVGDSLRHSLNESARLASAGIQPVVETTMASITRETSAFQLRLADSVQQQLDGVSSRFDRAIDAVAGQWTIALSRQAQSNESLTRDLQQSLGQAAETFAQSAVGLLANIDSGQTRLRADLAAQEQQRLVQFTASLASTAGDLQAQAEAHASRTIGEMSRLIDAASDAPRAAAEVMAALRNQLSDSMARDNDLLDERRHIMATLGTLLDAVNQAATEQRRLIDGLVASSATVLQQAGTRLGETIETETAKMAAAATQLTVSAVDVASLGEAFGAAVQVFGESSRTLTAQLQRIEAALGKSTARSDEQLAYYVAQAREVVDLSISSQRQIVEDLKGLALRQAPRAGAVA